MVGLSSQWLLWLVCLRNGCYGWSVSATVAMVGLSSQRLLWCLVSATVAMVGLSSQRLLWLRSPAHFYHRWLLTMTQPNFTADPTRARVLCAFISPYSGAVGAMPVCSKHTHVDHTKSCFVSKKIRLQTVLGKSSSSRSPAQGLGGTTHQTERGKTHTPRHSSTSTDPYAQPQR